MTFDNLFLKAMKSVDTTKQYEGRTAATHAVISALWPLVKEIVAKTPWTNCYIESGYGHNDPNIMVSVLGVSKHIPFKVRLKRAGKKHSYYGDTTCYSPVVAFTTDPDLLYEDIEKYLNDLYATDNAVKCAVAKDERAQQIQAQYAELVDRYNNTVDEINKLSFEEREALRSKIKDYVHFW